MQLTGMTSSNKRVPIKITDCPVRISKQTVILANKPGSELILNSTIRRILEQDSVYEEYSYVFDESFKFVGFLIFKDIFRIYNPQTKQYFELKDNMKFIPNTNIKIITQLSKVADPIRFSYKGEEFQFKHIIGVADNGILMYTRKNPRLLIIEDESEVVII